MPNTALQRRSLQHFSQHFPRRLLNNSPNIFSTILFKHLFLGPALTTLLPHSFPSQEGESDSTPHLAPSSSQVEVYARSPLPSIVVTNDLKGKSYRWNIIFEHPEQKIKQKIPSYKAVSCHKICRSASARTSDLIAHIYIYIRANRDVRRPDSTVF